MLEGLKRLIGRSSSQEIAPALAAYLRPDSAGIVRMRRPALRDAHEDVRAAWGEAAAKTIESIQNSGWLAGAIDQCVADTNGTGLKLSAQPDAKALGWSDDFAADWCNRVEWRWGLWANNPYECDLRGRKTVAAMADWAVRWFYGYGEAVALLPLRPRPGAQSALKVLMVPPHRLIQETRPLDRVHQGIRIDADGMPVGFIFKRDGQFGQQEEFEVRARDEAGRPNVVHVFDGDPSQARGITPLAPVLKIVAQYDQLADATLTTTLLQTIFAASLKSEAMSEEAFSGLMTEGDLEGEAAVPRELEGLYAARTGYYRDAKLDLGAHGRVNSLFPGDELEFHATEHPSNNYLPFSRDLKREMARCIGVTYEGLSGDFDGATYSSIQMGTSTIWAVTVRRRERISIPFVQAIYEAWLEEEIGEGRTAFPGGYEAFAKNRAAVCGASWRGPAKPIADDGKAAKAASERLTQGTTSLTYECGMLGLDVEDMMNERVQERKMAERRGLPDPHAPRPAPAIGNDNSAEPEEEDRPAGPQRKAA